MCFFYAGTCFAGENIDLFKWCTSHFAMKMFNYAKASCATHCTTHTTWHVEHVNSCCIILVLCLQDNQN